MTSFIASLEIDLNARTRECLAEIEGLLSEREKKERTSGKLISLEWRNNSKTLNSIYWTCLFV